MVTRQQRFVYAQVAVLVAIAVALEGIGALRYDLFFLVSLVGFAAVMEVSTPFTVDLRWQSRPLWVLAAGMVGFAYVAVRQVIAILPSGLL